MLSQMKMRMLEQKIPVIILVFLGNCETSKGTSLRCSLHKPVREMVLDLVRQLALNTIFKTLTWAIFS